MTNTKRRGGRWLMEINPVLPTAGQKFRLQFEDLFGSLRSIPEFSFTYSTISYETPNEPDILFC